MVVPGEAGGGVLLVVGVAGDGDGKEVLLAGKEVPLTDLCFDEVPEGCRARAAGQGPRHPHLRPPLALVLARLQFCRKRKHVR